jgi:hypothetical protein
MLIQQLTVSTQIISQEIPFDYCGSQLCFKVPHDKVIITRIQLYQHLPLAYTIANVDFSRQQLASHAEG